LWTASSREEPSPRPTQLTTCTGSESKVTIEKLTEFAKRYAKAWCSQNPTI
jgi:hypothetical protein